MASSEVQHRAHRAVGLDGATLGVDHPDAFGRVVKIPRMNISLAQAPSARLRSVISVKLPRAKTGGRPNKCHRHVLRRSARARARCESGARPPPTLRPVPVAAQPDTGHDIPSAVAGSGAYKRSRPPCSNSSRVYSKQPFSLGIGLDDALQRGVDHHNGIGRAIDQHTKTRFTFDQFVQTGLDLCRHGIEARPAWAISSLPAMVAFTSKINPAPPRGWRFPVLPDGA